ncbi:MAG: PTS IIA-like nitrogen regulatory protein PtsN [Gammaproteobacteria bacterium]|nr:PTS IIA-like nitrogen regulatory protein PtsN [Gammaproteobacteria bacterium]
MNISDIIAPERVACDLGASSKKRVLEKISDMIVSNTSSSLVTQDIINTLTARERLGSTGIGYGVAIPHGRVKDTDTVIAAFVQLQKGVDYDAADNQTVDLLFALLVPEKSTEEHLQLLAQLAEMFSDENFRTELRAAKNQDVIYQLLSHWKKAS